MKAAVLKEYNKPAVCEFPNPQAKDGLKVVDVLAAGLNPADLVIASGMIPQITPPLPAIVGIEGVGLLDGKRVYFEKLQRPYGSVGEQTLLDPANTYNVPDHLTDEQAISIGVAASTAWIALSWRGKIKPGEHVVILGATGAVGQMAVQAAKLLGAGRVVAAGRNKKVLERLKTVGADETVVLDADVPTLAGRFGEASQGKINLVIDMIWGPAASAVLMAASPGARLVSAGFAAAMETLFVSAIMFVPQTSILGFSINSVPIETKRETYAMLADFVKKGKFKLATEIYSLADFEKAWERQKKSPNGKIIIDLKR